ncbi:glycosyltransferase family 2 protein [Leeuwenhoekiella aestuarii]|uniref:Glycosyltransferase involved in cell wall biosynthesis n=1 Tax=Leeuwenhoekiella aestuarii TaxID=2249426 RepID=A0A4Q0NPN5_9FLAO|nr:glycosyltransferase family 2 protein [Leeuwenhoekiella aestuarii]RXG12337.1 glycosyltransferase involved in cell wall biosynthesis [Leeuwenhoekiella aestuarii]
MHEHLVSIIIPTYNRAHLIGETLDSVLAQSYTHWECIVVDDGSMDGTDEVLAGYVAKDSRFQYHHRPKDRPKGANACRNYGFELSRGEYVNWFDSDDLMLKEKLTIQIEELLKSNFDFCVCQVSRFNKNFSSIITQNSSKIYVENVFSSYLSLDSRWLTPSILWKRKVFDSFELLFNENLKSAQEWEFFCRILNKNDNYTAVNKVLIHLRSHKESISFDSNKRLREWNYFLARYLIRTNENINLSTDDDNYLKHYLVKSFKDFCRMKFYKESLKSYRIVIMKSEDFSFISKLSFFLGMCSYLLFNRGYYFFHIAKKNAT